MANITNSKRIDFIGMIFVVTDTMKLI